MGEARCCQESYPHPLPMEELSMPAESTLGSRPKSVVNYRTVSAQAQERDICLVSLNLCNDTYSTIPSKSIVFNGLKRPNFV